MGVQPDSGPAVFFKFGPETEIFRIPPGERDLAKASGVTRWLLWLQAIEKAQPADFPRLAQLARDNPAALQFVAARWAEIAPRHLFNALVAATKGGRALSFHDVRYAPGPGATAKTQTVIDHRNERVLGSTR